MFLVSRSASSCAKEKCRGRKQKIISSVLIHPFSSQNPSRRFPHLCTRDHPAQKKSVVAENKNHFKRTLRSRFASCWSPSDAARFASCWSPSDAARFKLKPAVVGLSAWSESGDARLAHFRSGIFLARGGGGRSGVPCIIRRRAENIVLVGLSVDFYAFPGAWY